MDMKDVLGELDEALAKELKEELERELDDSTERAMKRAKQLAGKPDLLERAAVARQRFAACVDRMGRLIAGQADENAVDEMKKATLDLAAASDEQLAIYMAVTDADKEQWEAAERRFYAARSTVEKNPHVHDLRNPKAR